VEELPHMLAFLLAEDECIDAFVASCRRPHDRTVHLGCRTMVGRLRGASPGMERPVNVPRTTLAIIQETFAIN
jgi:hypothetical protein